MESQKKILEQLVEEKLFVPVTKVECEHDYKAVAVKISPFSNNDYPTHLQIIPSEEPGDEMICKCTKCGDKKTYYK